VTFELTEAINCGLKGLNRAAIRARELREGRSEQAFPLQELLGNVLEAATVKALEIAEWSENAIRLSHHPQNVIVRAHRVLSPPNAQDQPLP
jgi:hypothetical protein